MAAGLALGLTCALFVSAAFGWIPSWRGIEVATYLGEEPEGLVLWHGSGFSDHRLFLIFAADDAWVERAVRHAELHPWPESRRGACLRVPSAPWWLDLAPETRGRCWRSNFRAPSYMQLHYASESGYVFVYDYSS